MIKNIIGFSSILVFVVTAILLQIAFGDEKPIKGAIYTIICVVALVIVVAFLGKS